MNYTNEIWIIQSEQCIIILSENDKRLINKKQKKIVIKSELHKVKIEIIQDEK